MEITEILKTETTEVSHFNGRNFHADIRLKKKRDIKFVILEGSASFYIDDEFDEDGCEVYHHVEKGEEFQVPEEWDNFQIMGNDLDMIQINIYDNKIDNG